MATYFDRYNKFRVNAEIKPIPGITIPVESNDKYIGRSFLAVRSAIDIEPSKLFRIAFSV